MATATTEVATPEPQATDQQRIDAAVAQFETDVAANEIPSVFAYDLLDSQVDDSGSVTLTICAWSGESVFDQVRDSIYRTNAESSGSVSATHVTTPVAAGDCINTQLIESALDHINAYDEFARSFAADPASFASDPRQVLVTDQVALNLTESSAQFVADDVYFLGSRVPGDIQESAVAELLWRRFSADGLQLIEIVVCRNMDPERGMYRDDVLLDDGKTDSASGPHSIDSFQLQIDSEEPGRWLIAGRQALIWSDCSAGDSWPDAVNAWQPMDTLFKVLVQ